MTTKLGLEKTVLASRYFLVPMYLGLIIYMAMYNVAFFGALYDSIREFITLHQDFKAMKELLELAAIDGIDMVMIANLIVMITVGSHSIFVNEIEAHTKSEHLPRFIKGLTSGILKVKMGASLVGVSAVHLLTSFINVNKIGWGALSMQLVIHLSFILSAFVFAKMEIMMHPPHAEAPETKSHEKPTETPV